MIANFADLASDVPVLGPIGVAVSTLGTVWTQILAADPQRRGLVFHNPGTANLRVAPANLPAQSTAGAFLIYAQEDLSLLTGNFNVNINCAWMGWVDSGSSQPATILNFTGTNNSVAAPEPLARLSQGTGITSPLATGVSVATASIAAIGANAQRRGVTFHNPGTVNLAVCPSNLTASIGAGSVILFPGQTKTYMADSRSRIRVNCGWKVIAASGSGNPLTILEHLG